MFNFKGCSGNFQCNLCHNKISRQGARRIASCNKAFNFWKYKSLVILASVWLDNDHEKKIKEKNSKEYKS